MAYGVVRTRIAVAVGAIIVEDENLIDVQRGRERGGRNGVVYKNGTGRGRRRRGGGLDMPVSVDCHAQLSAVKLEGERRNQSAVAGQKKARIMHTTAVITWIGQRSLCGQEGDEEVPKEEDDEHSGGRQNHIKAWS